MRAGALGFVVVLAACGQTGGAESSSSSSGSTGASSSGGSSLPPLPVLWGTTVLEDTNMDPAIVEVNLEAVVTTHTYVNGKTTEVWTYNGLVPGPTIQARQGDRVIIHFTNHLPEATTIHWHGLRIPDTMDGTPDLQAPVEPEGTFTYDFVVPDAGSFWYHPHYNTVQQIERGMMGTFIVHEPVPPAFDAERIIFNDDVRLTSAGAVAPFATAGMDIMHGRAGNTLLLNGQGQPFSIPVVKGNRERWRVFNGANGRTMLLTFEGVTWQVIGTDGGLVPNPDVRDMLEVAIGQRYDLEVFMDGAPGSTGRIISNIPALDANNEVFLDPIPLAELSYHATEQHEFRDVTWAVPAMPTLPSTYTPEKTLTLSGVNVNGVVKFTINGLSYPEQEMWMVGMQDVVVRITNQLGMEHPFHLHGQFFHVLGRSATDDMGLKDTVLVPGGGTVDILVHFNNPGMWMYHCHIPEHAEGGMMGHVHVHQ